MAITQVGTATSNATQTSPLTLTYPAGIALNDVCIVVIEERSGSGAAITEPLTFTSIRRDDNTTAVGVEAFRETCLGTESGTVDFPLTGATFAAGHLSVWRGVDTAAIVNISAGNASGGGDPVAPTAETTVNDCLVLRAHGGRFNGAASCTYTADAATTELTDVQSGSSTNPNISLMVAHETKATAGLVGTRTATCTQSLGSQASQTIALTPAAIAGGHPTVRRFATIPHVRRGRGGPIRRGAG